MKTKIKIVFLSALLFTCGSSLFSQTCVIYKKEAPPQKVIFMKAESNGDIFFKSSGGIQSKIKAKDYLYVRLTETPSEIEAAEKLISSGKYADAENAFKKLFDTYKFVGFDVLCIYNEAIALEKQGKKVDALARLKALDGYKLIDTEKENEFYDAKKLTATLYIDDKKFDDAMKILEELGKSNDDDIAAFGFNARGDICLKQGKNKDAVLMFMRTALLFPKENKERPRALLEIANTLKAINDNRAATFAEKLKSEYPGNNLIKDLK